jgi:hypothetical protein
MSPAPASVIAALVNDVCPSRMGRCSDVEVELLRNGPQPRVCQSRTVYGRARKVYARTHRRSDVMALGLTYAQAQRLIREMSS